MLNNTAELTRQTVHENTGSDLMHNKIQVGLASNPQHWALYAFTIRITL